MISGEKVEKGEGRERERKRRMADENCKERKEGRKGYKDALDRK